MSIIDEKDWHLWECGSPSESELHQEEIGPPKKKKVKVDEMDDSTSLLWNLPRLQKDRLPPSLPATLFRRHVGLLSSEQFGTRIDHHFVRQLHSGRAPCDLIPVEAGTHSVIKFGDKKLSKGTLSNPFNPTGKWSRIKNERGTGQNLQFMGECILVKDEGSNTRRFLQPNAPLLHSPFHLKFLIKDVDNKKRKWRDTDSHFINMHNPQMIRRSGENAKVLKLPNSLLVLEPLKLVSYDLNTGTKMDELGLAFAGGPSTYNSVIPDYNDVNRIYISASAEAVKKGSCDMRMEILIVDYPGFKILTRLLVPKSGDFGSLNDISIFQDLLIISKSDKVELFNLDEVIKINPKQIGTSMDGTNSLQVVRLVTKPERVVAKFKSMGGFMLQILGFVPPHVCLKKAKCYEVKSLLNPDEVVASIPNLGGDVVISVYDDERPRIMVAGHIHELGQIHELGHGLEIYELDTSTNIDTNTTILKLVFSTKDFEREVENENQEASSSRREGLRQLQRKDYARSEKSRMFGFGYGQELDLLAICMVADGLLHSTIFENKTFEVVMKLTPVRLTVPKQVKELDCREIVVQFNESNLAVILKLVDIEGKGGAFNEVYVVNLCGEVVPDDEVAKKKRGEE